jgi:transposase-like protein
MVKKTSYDNVPKAKVALEAIRGDKTIAGIAAEYNVASRLLSKCQNKLLANTCTGFVGNK